jgi:predicted dithiol-disulfide oxidoreductase (DUF899 family)
LIRQTVELETNNVTNATTGDEHGLGVFFRIGDDVFHTYSTFGRGTEPLTARHDAFWVATGFRGVTPGWPQKPTYG